MAGQLLDEGSGDRTQQDPTPLYPHLELEDHPSSRVHACTSAQHIKKPCNNAKCNTKDKANVVRELSSRSVSPSSADQSKNLLLSFLLMIVIGSGNKIFQKLQAVPMYNYPVFLNLLTTFWYIPISFAYIVPVARYGLFNNSISVEQRSLPKTPFAIMGALDCLAGIMQTFSAVYLPGPLLILLPQAAIPVSMALSGRILQQRYKPLQYVGAAVVLVGILVVLEPIITQRHAPSFVCAPFDEREYCTTCQAESTEEACLSHHLDDASDDEDGHGHTSHFLRLFGAGNNSTVNEDLACQWVPSSESSSHMATAAISTLIWSLVMILSCVPMTLSSVYKEVALGEEDLDPIYLNGWIALFQFAFSIVLSVPAGMASSPPIYPSQISENLWDGLKCYLGIGSIFTGCHTDELCSGLAPTFVNIYLLLNVLYNVLIIYILKFGSSNVLWLALTIMVPVGNLAFTLPFMPGGGGPMHFSDILGLVVILTGLVMYRFGSTLVDNLLPAPWMAVPPSFDESSGADHSGNDLRESLLGEDERGHDGVSV